MNLSTYFSSMLALSDSQDRLTGGFLMTQDLQKVNSDTGGFSKINPVLLNYAFSNIRVQHVPSNNGVLWE
jgi:hypothetical protein